MPSKTALKKARKAARAAAAAAAATAASAATDPLEEVAPSLRRQLSEMTTTAIQAAAAHLSAAPSGGRADRRIELLRAALRTEILNARTRHLDGEIAATTKAWLQAQLSTDRCSTAADVHALVALALEHPAVCFTGETFYASASMPMRRTLDAIAACAPPRDAAEAAFTALIEVEAEFTAGKLRKRDFTSILSGFACGSKEVELANPAAVAVALGTFRWRCVEVDGRAALAVLSRTCWLRVWDFVRPCPSREDVATLHRIHNTMFEDRKIFDKLLQVRDAQEAGLLSDAECAEVKRRLAFAPPCRLALICRGFDLLTREQLQRAGGFNAYAPIDLTVCTHTLTTKGHVASSDSACVVQLQGGWLLSMGDAGGSIWKLKACGAFEEVALLDTPPESGALTQIGCSGVSGDVLVVPQMDWALVLASGRPGCLVQLADGRLVGANATSPWRQYCTEKFLDCDDHLCRHDIVVATNLFRTEDNLGLLKIITPEDKKIAAHGLAGRARLEVPLASQLEEYMALHKPEDLAWLRSEGSPPSQVQGAAEMVVAVPDRVDSRSVESGSETLFAAWISKRASHGCNNPISCDVAAFRGGSVLYNMHVTPGDHRGVHALCAMRDGALAVAATDAAFPRANFVPDQRNAPPFSNLHVCVQIWRDGIKLHSFPLPYQPEDAVVDVVSMCELEDGSLFVAMNYFIQGASPIQIRCSEELRYGVLRGVSDGNFVLHATLDGHRSGIYTAVQLADGRLVSASLDGELKVWG